MSYKENQTTNLVKKGEILIMKFSFRYQFFKIIKNEINQI